MNRAQTNFNTGHASRRGNGFTLIELLVVIAVMAILAALIFGGLGGVKRFQIRTTVKNELENITTAIEIYNSKRGTYPADNTNSAIYNPLFYELSGTTFNPASSVYTLLDGSTNIPEATVRGTFNIGGFANATRGGGDEGITAQKFIKNLKPNQYGDANGVRLLVSAAGWPELTTAPVAGTTLNPWRYVSTNPTNMPGKYDLWVDVLIGGKTNRICNWSDHALVL